MLVSVDAVNAPDNRAMRREAALTALSEGLRGFAEHDAARAVIVLLGASSSEVRNQFRPFKTDFHYDGGSPRTEAGLLLAESTVLGPVGLFGNEAANGAAGVQVFLGEDGKLKSQYTVPIHDVNGRYRLSKVVDGLGPSENELVRNLYETDPSCLDHVTERVSAVAEAGITASMHFAEELNRKAQALLEAKNDPRLIRRHPMDFNELTARESVKHLSRPESLFERALKVLRECEVAEAALAAAKAAATVGDETHGST